MTAGIDGVLVTGGAGFIGSNYVRMLLSGDDVRRVRVLDSLTYSGTRSNLEDVLSDPRVEFIEGDICEPSVVRNAMDSCDSVVNFAAETHVDRSLHTPADFINTNIHGTWVLLECARLQGGVRFVQVSTDEVYGAVPEGYSTELDRLHPRNPYSASKAGAEMMVLSYVETHGLDAVISRGSNTYGPYQHPEKFIPLMITNILQKLPVPVYGDGLQVRHWIHVEDHCFGIEAIRRSGATGEAYNIGSDTERTNLDVVRHVLGILDAPEDLIQHVTDRPGHDRRYALASDKLKSLGWQQKWGFERGIEATVNWYLEHAEWWQDARGGEFEQYYERNYLNRNRTVK